MVLAVDSIRTCTGCGAQAHPDELERFVLVADVGLLHDLRGKAGGRGAHVHANPECLAKAARSGFRRAFRQDVTHETDRLLRDVRDAILVRLRESILVAARSRWVAVGQEAVAEAMRQGRAEIVFLAEDAAEGTRTKFASNAERKGLKVVSGFDGATLGAWTAREFVSVLTVFGTPARRVGRDVKSLGELDFFEG